MVKNAKADFKDTVKRNYNPVSLGILYFSFSLVLWSSNQTIAIISSLISFVFFAGVFSEHVLKFLNKIVVRLLVPLTFVVFTYSFTIGVLQTILQTSGTISQIVAYFGFAWIVVFLLILVRPAVKKPNHKKDRISSLTPFLPYVIVVIFVIVAGIKFNNHDFWGGSYSIFIAGLVFTVARGCLKVRGEVFELLN